LSRNFFFNDNKKNTLGTCLSDSTVHSRVDKLRTVTYRSERIEGMYRWYV